MSKRGSPALYELIRARGSQRVPPVDQPPKDAAPVDDDSPLPGSWLRPGRTLHIPIGYVLLAAAGAIMLVLLSYTIGYSRGGAEARHLGPEEAERYLATGRHDSTIPRDPLDSATNTRPEFSPAVPRAGRDSSAWGPIESDPRQSGMHYLILMTTDRSGAEQFILFARERGLETYMISSNNRRFRVFALPGFADHNTAEAQAFREDVLRLGQIWMQQERSRINPVGTSMWSLYR